MNLWERNSMIFDSAGEHNTETALSAAGKRAAELGIHEIVVSSTSGKTAFKALDILTGFRVVVVTYHCGFREPFHNVMPVSVRAELEGRGARVVSATHALSGVERSIAKTYGGTYPVLLVADTLRLFGQGTKVAVEIAIMAADAGALSGEDIISVGGTARGVDTALVLKPAHQSNVFKDLFIKEVVCKPRSS
jgi:hypothetical protein